MSEEMKPRKLSRFLCQELMYDYASDELDPVRRKAMDNFLKDHPDSRNELEATNLAINYCGELSKIKISEPLREELTSQKSFVKKTKEKLQWEEWPELLKWGGEAFVISLIVALIAVLLPWEEINRVFTSSNRVVTLAEVERAAPKEAETELESPAPKSGKEKKKAVVVSEAASPTPKVTKVEEPTPEAKPGPQKGVLYRAYMDLKDLDDLSPKLVTLVTSMGGVKAGEVRLGWRKPNGRYFHFSMPKVNYDSLLKKLRGFGPVRIYKNPHGRVMPEGEIRIILWVEDQGSEGPIAPVDETPENEPQAVEDAKKVD